MAHKLFKAALLALTTMLAPAEALAQADNGALIVDEVSMATIGRVNKYTTCQRTVECQGATYDVNALFKYSDNLITFDLADQPALATTRSCGFLRNVEVKWSNSNAADATLQLYGSATPYHSYIDLYNPAMAGQLIATLDFSNDREANNVQQLTIDTDYPYVALLPTGNNVHLRYVRFTWQPDDSLQGLTPTVAAEPQLTQTVDLPAYDLSGAPATVAAEGVVITQGRKTLRQLAR